MNKTKRMAVACLVSLLVNAIFWLAYAHELRTASATMPQPPEDNTAHLRALRLPPPFHGFPPPQPKEKPAPAARKHVPTGAALPRSLESVRPCGLAPTTHKKRGII